MQLKKCKTNEQNPLSLLKQYSKKLKPVQISPKESQRKSNTSTHLSERSNSTRKLFLPKSNKLSHFFNESAGQKTVRKTLTSAEPKQTSKPCLKDKKQTNMGERIEFLKFNVNRDYFDEENEQKLLREKLHKQLNLNNNQQYQQRYQINRLNKISSFTSSWENSYSKKLGIQSEKQISKFPRMKSPKTLVRPIAKIMQKGRGHGKMYSVRSLEYTFGVQI